MEDHTHECRRCGESIPCDGDGENCWEGDNVGCLNEAAENATDSSYLFFAETEEQTISYSGLPLAKAEAYAAEVRAGHPDAFITIAVEPEES